MNKSNRMRAAAIAVALILLQAFACAGDLPSYFKLTILHTNDVHGHMLPFDYAEEQSVGGVARRGTMIRKIRSRSRCPVIVMDAGDVFTRGPLAAAYRGKPDIEAMNAIPYDIMTLGNNEFKGADGLEGQTVMRERIRQARFPIVCANVIEKSTGKPLVAPYRIIKVKEVKVGVFGLTAPRVAAYSQAEGLEIRDPIATAKEIVPKLMKEADVIVALTHIGDELDQVLAAAVPEIDLIVGGDSHTWLFKPIVVRSSGAAKNRFWVGGPVIVQDGEFGKCLGRIDLSLRREGSHDYQVMSFQGRLVPVTAATPDLRAVDRVLAPYVRPFLDVVGSSSRRMGMKETAQWTAEALRKVSGADVGAHSVSGVESGIPNGRVTKLDLMKAYPFDNYVVTVRLTGKQIADLVGATNCAAAGAEGLDPSKTYVVAAEDYLLSIWPQGRGLEGVRTGKRVREVVRDYMRATKSGDGGVN